ncbi:LD-carboxypeptidase [Acinetobacter rudis]|uniref:LD-carboxypeptidase n=1 Tax=Acinetobacter rudis TaxID=632955 RepID=A0AAW8J712_9GAMM|nr:LD-carboxypeptidase [Acinetobacter rudis]MDQ8934908.1 LD-carboxypeptidase [Acinetobacter rudis]MDQ9017309.1 LD-carboxypeptidase [Acinetobacter rudis]
MHFHIVTPSSCVDLEHIQLAQHHLQELGHQVSLAKHISAQHRYLAGTVEQRISDLKHATLDPSIDVIWCGRGGVGAAQLVPHLDNWILNKPVIGYSDSTVLLNYIALQGGQALHGPVFQEIAVKNIGTQALSNDALATIELINSPTSPIGLKLEAVNHKAQNTPQLQAQVLGGNLTVLCSLQGTVAALTFKQDSILLLEDVGEAYYHLERCLTQILQSTDTSLLKAVIMGDFYNCPQKNVPHSLEHIFAEHLDRLGIALYQSSQFGHGLSNHPLWIGKTAQIQNLELVYL